MGYYRSSENSFIWLLNVIALPILAFWCGRGLLVDNESAVRTLKTQGYSDIQITDHSWFAVGWRGCDDNDAARFTAQAKNPAGQTVTVYVCSGILKGGTVRIP